MMVVDVSAGADSPGKPTLLFEEPYQLKIGANATNYDVTPESPDSTGTTQITLVLNWFDELKRLVPTN